MIYSDQSTFFSQSLLGRQREVLGISIEELLLGIPKNVRVETLGK